LKEIKIDLGAANPKQALFYRSRALYTAYGGAKGGGKTHAVRVKAAGGAARYPGIRILIVRRTYAELQQNHIEPLVRLVPSGAARYSGEHHTMYFANGSVIKFGHFGSATAEREYQGQEYDWIFIDEATQFTEREFRYLGGCLRGTAAIPKRLYLTCNPGGIGHAWVKRLFIDRAFRGGEDPEDYAFIFASVEDNAALLRNSPAYLQLLESLPENLRRAYRYGEWDALAGTYFTELDEGTHVVAPFDIPETWTRMRAFDYGLDMLACLWVARSPEGRSVVYRELRCPNLVVSEAARAICDHTPKGERVTVTFAPPDMWSRQKDTGRTMAELFTRHGVPIVRADNSRVGGHLQIKELLRARTDNAPALVFFDTCRGVVSDISRIAADARNPNDCAREPHDVTHAVDALRYCCASAAQDAASGEIAPQTAESAEYEPLWPEPW
jgi:phage terminase large subunit